MLLADHPSRAQRLSLSRSRGLGRTTQPFFAFLLAMFLMLSVLVLGGTSPASASVTSTSPTTTAAPQSLDLDIAVTNPNLDEGQPLRITVTAENLGTTRISEQSVNIGISFRQIATRFALSNWINGESSTMGIQSVTNIDLPQIAPGTTESLEIEIPADELPFRPNTAWGPYGVVAVPASDTPVEPARSIVVWNALGEAQPTAVSVAVPLNVPRSTTGLLTAEQLATATATNGTLRRQLDSIIDSGATAMLDPMVLASIRVLGEDAPASAQLWLEDLRKIAARVSLLEYANADPVVLHDIDSTITPSTIPRPDGSLVPAADATALPGSLPSIVDLQNYAIDEEFVTSYAASHPDSTLVIPGDFTDEFLGNATLDAAATLDEAALLVADSELQTLLDLSISSDSEVDRNAATADALGLLSLITRELPSSPRNLVAVLPITDDDAALGSTLQALDNAPWVRYASFDDAKSAPSREVALVDETGPEYDTDRAQSLVNSEQSVRTFSTILDDARILLAERRLALVAALDAWLPEADRETIGNEFEAVNASIVESVQIIPGSNIQVVGDTTALPITVTNSLPQAVTVRITGRANTGVLVFPDGPVDVTIGPETQQRVSVPVRAVASGSTIVTVTLSSVNGDPVASPVQIQVGSEPAVETILLWSLGIAVALLLGFGVWRSIRKRRRGEAHGDFDNAVAEESAAETNHASSDPAPKA
ncbi:DUF6049 family protein [Humidisolicoccus flavus]|uniref:DUF6049 family protein n=1 Tax=Humidisolicoccus flavus TaxID=3111414 RepID=UPI003248912F